ncbi:SAFB-like transcription modulator [Pseudoliparis swirei]|uniref:SAFB-like transcription modulator n=1 Tax=Pseudoliparis swirei TaxID=2059687 RepID=UPI0024BD6D6B|nr:SAFB-like transcription modulator [Pseudoliparis swirei]
MCHSSTVPCFVVEGLEISEFAKNQFFELPKLFTQKKMPVSTNNIISEEELTKWTYLNGLDFPRINADVDLLIGTNSSKLIEPWEVINSHANGPYAIKTLLGWMINGPLQKYSDELGSGYPAATVNRISIKNLKKAEMGDKEKDSGKKGPCTTGASGRAKSSSRDRDGKATKDEKAVCSSGNSSSSRNIWLSGLSSNTKAAVLKNLFGKYGKVLSAKVVTNARSPGSKCGLVTMSSSTEVTRCLCHLDCTQLHGKKIYVKRAKNGLYKKEDKNLDKLSEKDKDFPKKQEVRSGKSETVSSNSGQ